jgi:TolB-like protein/Tfp pilus assembly protein PilF
VFLSYAREDSPAAQRLADALRSHGIEVWFDQSELRGGDVWDQKIRRQIKECSLFVPVISARTQSRGEGYFRLEWRLAVERTHLMAEGMPFLAPVVVDETPEGGALVPAEFLRVQWIRLPGALPTPQFVAQVRRLLEPPSRGSAAPMPSPAPALSAPSRSPSAKWIAAGAGLVVMAAVAALLLLRKPAPAAQAPAAAAPPAASRAPVPGVDPKSVAVLPFENMSEDKDNAFFADGVHEDVLTNLSFVKDLHVVSRTSVMQYRNTTKPIKEIGKELGVAYILEGSVQRQGNKVRVTGQLIDARTDEHVWAKAYDRDISDIFAIQGELAQAIADALQSVITPDTRRLITRRPTENQEAYDLYLKARDIRANMDYLVGRADPIILLEKAVKLDPNFAEAWGELGSRRAFSIFNGKVGDEAMRQAKEAIDNADRLAPDDPVVIESLGDFYYYAFRDYDRATEQYNRLASFKPNDATVFMSLGLIQRRQGRIDDAIASMKKAVALDPANGSYDANFLETLVSARHYDETLDEGARQLEAHPGELMLKFGMAMTHFLKDGSTEEAKNFYSLKVPGEQAKMLLYLQKTLAGVQNDFAMYLRLDKEQPYMEGFEQDAPWNQQTIRADALAETGDMAGARAEAADCLLKLRKVVADNPGNSMAWSDIALCEALLGHHDAAMEAVRRCSDALPETRDAVSGPSNSMQCAMAMAWAGEKDRAIAEIARLLKVPYGGNVHSIYCRPLWDDPRYKALLADPANNAVLH